MILDRNSQKFVKKKICDNALAASTLRFPIVELCLWTVAVKPINFRCNLAQLSQGFQATATV